MFTETAFDILSVFWSGIAGFFQLQVPGTNVSFLMFGLSCMATVFFIRLIKNFLGFGVEINGVVNSNINKNKRVRVSKERKGDEK